MRGGRVRPGPATGVAPASRPTGLVRAVAGYTAARLVLLVLAGALAFLAGLRGVLLLVAALLVSGLVSLLLLTRQRVAMTGAVQSAWSVVRGRLAERTAREDAAAEEWHHRLAEEGGGPGSARRSTSAAGRSAE